MEGSTATDGLLRITSRNAGTLFYGINNVAPNVPPATPGDVESLSSKRCLRLVATNVLAASVAKVVCYVQIMLLG